MFGRPVGSDFCSAPPEAAPAHGVGHVFSRPMSETLSKQDGRADAVGPWSFWLAAMARGQTGMGAHKAWGETEGQHTDSHSATAMCRGGAGRRNPNAEAWPVCWRPGATRWRRPDGEDAMMPRGGPRDSIFRYWGATSPTCLRALGRRLHLVPSWFTAAHLVVGHAVCRARRSFPLSVVASLLLGPVSSTRQSEAVIPLAVSSTAAPWRSAPKEGSRALVGGQYCVIHHLVAGRI